MQTGKRNPEPVGGRNRHGQGWVAGEIHRDCVLQLKDVRVENAYCQVEHGKQWRGFLKGRQRDDIDLLEYVIERLLPCALPL